MKFPPIKLIWYLTILPSKWKEGLDCFRELGEPLGAGHRGYMINTALSQLRPEPVVQLDGLFD